MSQSSFWDFSHQDLPKNLKGPAHHHVLAAWFARHSPVMTPSQSMESQALNNALGSSEKSSGRCLSRLRKKQVPFSIYRDVRDSQACSWKHPHSESCKKRIQKYKYRIHIQRHKNTEVNITYLEKRWNHCMLRQSSEPTPGNWLLLGKLRSMKLHTQVPEACGRRAWGWASSFRLRCLCWRQGSGKARWKGPMQQRWRCWWGKGRAWWLLGKFGDIEACHPQIINENKKQELWNWSKPEWEITTSLKTFTRERVYQGEKKKKKKNLQ